MRSAGFHQANMIAENLNTVREEVLTEVQNVQNVVANAMANLPQIEEINPAPPQNQTANAVIQNPDYTALVNQITNLTAQMQNMQNNNGTGGRGGRGGRGGGRNNGRG